MGMPLELNTLIITKGREKRVSDNIFVIVKANYRLYPMEVPIEVRREISGETSGTALVRKLEWSNTETVITYELVSLSTPN